MKLWIYENQNHPSFNLKYFLNSLVQSIPACTCATCINVVGSYHWLDYANYQITLYGSLLSLTLCFLFCFVIAYLHCCIFRIPPRGSTLQVTWCPCLTHLLPPLAMWDVASTFSLPPSSGMTEFACRLHCKSSVAAFSWHLVPCTSWILHVMNCV